MFLINRFVYIKKFKFVILTIIGVIVGLFFLLYGILNTSYVQNYIRQAIVEELQSKLGSQLGIERLKIKPFNSVELDNVYLCDLSGDKIFVADKIFAQIELFPLFQKKLIFGTAQINYFNVTLSKDSSNALLNIQFILDAFKSQKKASSHIQIKLSAISMANGNFSYDVKDKPSKEQFDPNHISVSNLNARLALKSLVYDSLNIQIKRLTLKEKSGLQLKNLTTRLVTQNQKASIRGFRLDLPHSFLQFDKCQVDLSKVQSNNELIDNATFNCIISPSYFSPKDIASFSPAFKYFVDQITLQGRIYGAVDDITVSDLKFSYGERMHLSSNVQIKNIRNPEKTYLQGKVDKLFMTGMELETLLNNFQREKVKLPSSLKDFKSITFEGAVSGYLKQLTASGRLDTDAGIIQTELQFGKNPNGKVANFLEGKISSNSLDMGKLSGKKDLGQVIFELDLDMQQSKNGKFEGNTAAQIHMLEYKGYTYSSALLNLNYDGLKLNGNFAIDDYNGKIDIKGLFDFSNRNKPELNFRAQIKDVKLDNLRLFGNHKNSSNLSLNISANFEGANIDNLEGYIRVDSLNLVRNNQSFLLNHFLLQASGTLDDRKLSIKSDLLNADIDGAYSFTTMPPSIQNTLSHYIPALVNKLDIGKYKNADVKDNNMVFTIQINNTQKLNQVINIPVSIIDDAKITGYYNNKTDRFKVEVFTPYIKVGNTEIKSGYVLAENSHDVITNQIKAFIVGKNNMMNQISLNSEASNNRINSKIEFYNNVKKAKGILSFSSVFSRAEDNHLNINADIEPSSFTMDGTRWELSKTHLTLLKDNYSVANFVAETNDSTQSVRIDGTYAPYKTNALLKTELKNINLGYIFENLGIEVLKFGGSATGKVFLSSIDGKPYANTRLNIDNFKFNGTELGNLNLFSEFDDETLKVKLNGFITNEDKKKTFIDGNIDPINEELSIKFNADSLNIAFLNAYASSVFNDIQGRGSGNIHLFGNFSNVTVEGDAFVYDASLGINFLNTRYNLSDSIHLKSNLIYFNNIKLRDKYNKTAIGSGKIAHHMLSDMSYYIDLTAQNFLLYDVPEKQNSVFSGKVFGSGKCSISGDERAVDIDVRVKTEDNTVVRMNFMEDIVDDYNFITYKSKKPLNKELEKQDKEKIQPLITNSEMEVNMNFYIDATPAAVAEIVMDPVGGDVLKGSGSGALQFTWSTKASPRIYGNYLINRGSYLFTFQRLLEKRFIIEDGSSIHFDGDPFHSNLNIDAIYRVTANLNDLSSSLVESSGQTNIRTNCILKLTGPLRHPNVGLDLAFPNIVPEMQRQIKVFLNSEDMINKQVAYLLLMSKFYTPGNSDTEYRTSDFAVLASATLSNQLTKIISKLDSHWQLGTNIRTSDSEMTNTEIELLLSSQLLNDRLLINGNFGYRDDPKIARDAFIGDVDVEYLLNAPGTWRVKAYNRYNEKFYYTGTAEQTQGVGIKYKKDFDKPIELLPWRTKSRERKSTVQDSIITIVPDSTKKGSGISNFIKLKK